MPSSTPSRYFLLPVRSYAVAITARLLSTVLFDPQSNMLAAGPYASPHAFAFCVARYLSAPLTTDARIQLRSAARSRFGTVARAMRPGAAVNSQPNPPGTKTSERWYGEESRALRNFFSP